MEGAGRLRTFVDEVVNMSRSSSPSVRWSHALATVLLLLLVVAASERVGPCAGVLCAVLSESEALGTPTVSQMAILGRILCVAR